MSREIKRSSYIFLLMLLMISLCTQSGAVPMPALDLPALTKDSSHIVIGEVISLRDAGPGIFLLEGGRSISVQKRFAELRVSRVLKGQITSAQTSFEVLLTRAYYGFAEIKIGQFGMFFLKPGASNAFSLTSNYYPYVVAARTNLGVTGNDYERVIAEIVNALALPETTADDKVKAINALFGIDMLNVTPSLRQTANSENPKVRLSAVAALLRRNDISNLKVAETALLRPPAGIDQSLIANLASSLMEVKDPKAIPVLARLLKSSSVTTRHAAVYALRHTNVVAAIKPLTQALYDSDQNVRYQGVMGLAKITEQYSRGATIDRYNAEEQRYLTYWRDWAAKR